MPDAPGGGVTICGGVTTCDGVTDRIGQEAVVPNMAALARCDWSATLYELYALYSWSRHVVNQMIYVLCESGYRCDSLRIVWYTGRKSSEEGRGENMIHRVLLALIALLAFAGCSGTPNADRRSQVTATATQVAEPALSLAKGYRLQVTDTPTPGMTSVLTAAPSMTATMTATMSPTAAPSITPTAVITPTLTPTATPTLPMTATVEAAAAVTPTVTATVVPVDLRTTENILVLGADVRPGPWMMHTDSIMLLAIDREHGQVGVLSIPRDLWVDVPGWGADRINSAYFLGDYTKYPGGSPALAKKVVEETLGVPVNHTVLIKMDGLAKLVDAIGGVTVHLDCPLYEQTPDPKNPNRTVNWQLPAGDVQLDGASARKFATYRYLTSDFGRARRQQQLIWAIREKAQSANLLPRLPELWQALGGTFETDMNLLDVARLAKFGLDLQPGNLHGAALDGVVQPHVTGGGASVLVIKDQAALDARLATLFAGRPLADLGKSQAGQCPPKPAGFR
jgi:LCP family protein required for cell wall assembly